MCQLHQQDEASRAWALCSERARGGGGRTAAGDGQPAAISFTTTFLLLHYTAFLLQCGPENVTGTHDVSVVFTSSSVMIIHCQWQQRKHTVSLRDGNMKLLPVCWPLLRPLAAQGPSAAGPCPWVTHSQSLSLSLSLCVCVCVLFLYTGVYLRNAGSKTELHKIKTSLESRLPYKIFISRAQKQ